MSSIYHFIWEAVKDGKVLVVYIPTDENLAKIFMKALAKVKFQHFVKLLGLHMRGSVEVLQVKPVLY